MRIWWFKDSKIGHEKQVRAILDNLACSEDFILEEISTNNPIWLELLLYMLKIRPKIDSIPDIIIGAGSKTNIPMLRHKLHKKTKVISVMKPQFFQKRFDLIVAPRHDFQAIPENVHTYIGSIAKVRISEDLEDIGLIVIGGINRHFDFNCEHILLQINFIISLYPEISWIIFNSRRTPQDINIAIKNNKQIKKFIDFNENFEPLDNYISKAKIKFVTPDSVNMIFESLSSSGETFLFEMKKFKDNKITMLIDDIKRNRFVGYLEEQKVEGSSMKKLSLAQPNKLHEPLREVEKVVYKIKQILDN